MYVLSSGCNAKQIPQWKVYDGWDLLLPELIEKKNVFRQAEKIKYIRFVQGWSSTKWLCINRIEAAENEVEWLSKGTKPEEIKDIFTKKK